MVRIGEGRGGGEWKGGYNSIDSNLNMIVPILSIFIFNPDENFY